MVTWRERFEELSQDQALLINQWRAGDLTPLKFKFLRKTTEKITLFLACYEQQGHPDRDSECCDWERI